MTATEKLVLESSIMASALEQLAETVADLQRANAAHHRLLVSTLRKEASDE